MASVQLMSDVMMSDFFYPVMLATAKDAMHGVSTAIGLLSLLALLALCDDTSFPS